MKRLTTFCVALFLFSVFSFLAYQHQHKPRIFILHSYSAKMPWVQGLDRGIKNVFGDKAYISLRYFYMDHKFYSSLRYRERTGRALQTIIAEWRPDILIAFDEDAHTLAAQEFSHSNKVKVILAGITDTKRWTEYETIPNLTGVTEQIPVRAIREILSLLFRNQKRIYYLSDNSTVAKALDETIVKQNWGSYTLVKHKRVNTLEEWRAAVEEAEQTADILLVSTYQKISEGKRFVPPPTLVKWMNAHCQIPIVGIYESYIIDGGTLAIAISSLEQGQTAAQLALNIIEKKLTIQNVPLIHGKTFSLFLQKEQLLKRFPDAQIPVILDAFSEVPKGRN